MEGKGKTNRANYWELPIKRNKTYVLKANGKKIEFSY